MVVVITGASSGIGLETAKLYLSKGDKVYALNRSKVELENIQWVKCDISSSKDISHAYKIIKEKEEHIDLLINNAGIGISGAVEYHSEEEINKIISINLTGLINVTRVFIPLLKNNNGKIINISSVAGVIPIPFQTLYSVTKSGVLAFSEGLRNELRPLGIKVTSILPGDTKTGFTAAREKSIDKGEYKDRIIRSVEKMEKDENNGVPACFVAKKIYKVSKKKNPNTYYVVGKSYSFLAFLFRLLPKRFVSWIIYQIYGK